MASFIAALFAGLFIGTIACGFLADRFGRRAVFTGSLLWDTVANVIMAFQETATGVNFWRFVVGHAPFELTAIVIAGGAGLQLGLRLLAPGRMRRIDALIEGGRVGARLCLGVAFMLLVAAFIEAFWSSIAWVPMWGKLTVSGVLWTLVILWLWRGGRGSAHAH